MLQRRATILLAAIFLTLWTSQSRADFNLNYISQTQFNDTIRELSANGNWASVTPPSSLGSIFGVELGVVGGATDTPSLDAIVYQQSGQNLKLLPHASLMAQLTIPLAITFEATYVPKTTLSGASYQMTGGAVKWTPTDGIMILPVNLAFRGFYTSTELSFSQTINNVTVTTPVTGTIKYGGQVSGVQVMVSPKLIPILEPYAGVGYLTGKGKFDVTASTGTIFDFTSSQSSEATNSSSQVFFGLDIRLLLLSFGAEYSQAFGTKTYNARLSLRF